MSTDTENVDTTDTDDDPDAYQVFRAVVRKAEANDIPAGPGRAAWVLTEWDRYTPGTAVFMNFAGRYSAGSYRCDSCDETDHDHPGTSLILPSEDAPKGGAGVMAAPFCPACAVRRLRESLV